MSVTPHQQRFPHRWQPRLIECDLLVARIDRHNTGDTDVFDIAQTQPRGRRVSRIIQPALRDVKRALIRRPRSPKFSSPICAAKVISRGAAPS